ncbi:MAG: OmpA family protein [Bacteroidales bacterium]|nr:OmpA family protein [Bacteroidales bacterium]
MKKIVSIFLFTFFVVTVTFAQQKVKINKKDFYTTDIDFNDAWKNLKKGSKLYKQNQKGSYQQAIDLLVVAYDYNPDNPLINYQLGVSYLLIHDEVNGLLYIEEAFNLSATVTEDIHFWLGRANHLNAKFDEAIIEYKLYRDALSEKELKKQGAVVNKYISECEAGILLSNEPINVIIDNLGDSVNSSFADYSPVFAPYDSVVFFTSRRPNTIGGKRNRKVSNEYFEDVYYTSALHGTWQSPAQMDKPINSRHNDASVAVNPNGTGVLVYRGHKGSGNIFISFKKIKGNGDDKWTKPKQVIKRINTKKYKESSLTFNSDSTLVYFVSNRKKGYGGKDIWMSRRRGNSNSGWTKPVNIGKPVNTIYDEESVYLQDDSVLYFASKGHNSMGGYDLFKAYILPDGRWGDVVNVGYPLNTPDDDMFMFMNADNKTGYFTSSGQDDNQGDMDMYEFFFYSPKDIMNDAEDDLIAYIKEPVNELIMDEPVVISTMRLTVVKGIVSEYETMKPLYATIEIIDNATQEVVQTIMTNATTGAYTVMLPSGKDYGMSVNADGYMFHSENFNIPSANGYQEIIKDIQLLPVDPGSKIVLRNVFFNTGSADLRPESYPELTRLAEAFKLYPNLVIEISGHTDSQGSATSNMTLSQNRAQSVVDYLVSIGVERTHLIAQGYGEDQPVADNSTADGRQLNRRVEAKIVSN